MADIQVCQGCSEVLRIGKLLSLIHSGLCKHSKTIAQHDEERKWKWMEKQEKVFKRSREKFTKKPVLAVLDLN